MKRYRIKSHFRFITFLIIVFLLSVYLITTIAGLNIVDSADDDNYRFETVTVVAGDTLWSIADTYTDGHDLRQVVYDIREINRLDDSVIRSGDQLKIPVYD
jgi:hypothetical protein